MTALHDGAQADDKSAGKPNQFVGTRVGQVRDDNGLKLKVIWCPPGKFTMGSPRGEEGRDDEDEDQVSVRLTNGFWLGKYEVTQAQWGRVMRTTPWKGRRYVVSEGDDYPAMYVTWNDATKFCETFTETERRIGRLPPDWKYALPTEAQWEYACRGGTTTRFSSGDKDADLNDYAWWGGRSGDGNAKDEQYTHKVGIKRANPWGFHDMHGNVEEWCRDAFVFKLPGGDDPWVRTGRVAKPDFRGGGTIRATRGGDWWNPAQFSRSASRGGTTPGDAASFLGFRLALVPSAK
jgi:formylglycine-generating enzyme required for sulfatase activity